MGFKNFVMVKPWYFKYLILLEMQQRFSYLSKLPNETIYFSNLLQQKTSRDFYKIGELSAKKLKHS